MSKHMWECACNNNNNNSNNNKNCEVLQCYIHFAGFEVLRCSEVAHGVCWVCQIGMESEMHGLWIRHDCGRLLLLSPPQTRRLRVQVPLCGIQQATG